MKNTFGWIFASISLMGIALCYILATGTGPNTPQKPTANAQAKPTVVKPAASSTTKSRPSFSGLHGKELEDKLNEVMAKNAKVMTPELAQKMTDAEIESAAPRYRELFVSWKLDPSTSDQIIGIIHNRQLQMREAFYKLNRDGMSGGQEYAEAKRHAKEWAEVHLTTLLGSDRYNELARLDTQLESKKIARNPGVVNLLAKP